MDKAKKPQSREPSQHTDSKVLYCERVDLCFINVIARIIFKIIFKIYLLSETKGTICHVLFGLKLYCVTFAFSIINLLSDWVFENSKGTVAEKYLHAGAKASWSFRH